ncbi:hypothetical protein J6TS7_55240 [Paenibacillus dendritiformis]|nr:hypothetical protein J6TS7_55240 [Paenibacillus dendritiformis]
MKKHILVRALLFGIFAYTLRFLFDGVFDVRDVIAPIIFILLCVNEYYYKKKKTQKK